MKRTLEQSKTFFNRKTNTRGKGRELYLTPINVIKQVVQNLIETNPQLKEKTWIDPCAADGRWQDIIQSFGIKCKSFDIHPLNENVVQKDFLSLNAFEYNKDYFFCGNPPFSLLKEFINQSLLFADSCYFLGGSQIITGKLSSKVSLLHRFEGYEGNQKDLRSKISFIDTNNKNVLVWCCGALFNKQDNLVFNRTKELIDNSFRVGIFSFCCVDNRVVCLKK